VAATSTARGAARRVALRSHGGRIYDRCARSLTREIVAFDRKNDANVWMQNTNRKARNMHPATSHLTITAHVRDLQRSMHPERSKRPLRPLSWIRKSR